MVLGLVVIGLINKEAEDTEMKIKLSELRKLIKEEISSQALKPMYTQSGVAVYNIIDVFAHLFGDEYWEPRGALSRNYENDMKHLRKFADSINAFVYERPRSDFDEAEAIDMAITSGKTAVIIHDLS